MRFRTQTLLAFVPMFMLLGAGGETVRALLENRELRWGMREEVSSLAVSISEFLRDRPMAAPRIDTSPAKSGRTWQQSLEDIVRNSQARRVWLFGPDGRKVIRGWSAAPVDRSPHAMPADCKALLATKPWAIEPQGARGGEGTLVAYAPLRAAGGGIAGYIAVEIGTEDYVRALSDEKRKIVTGTAISLLAGLVAIGLLVAPVTRGARDLSEAADRAREGHPFASPGSRFIREIDELGETFRTMGTLLNEAMDKARRILVENEQLRASKDLADAFRARFNPVQSSEFAAVETAVRLAGGTVNGAFAGCRQIRETIWCFVGRVSGADELDQTLCASAASLLLEDALGRLPPPAAFAEVARSFPLADWKCIGCPADGGTPLRWTGRAGDPLTSAAPLDGAGAYCLHTFGPDRQRIVDACLEGFGDLPVGEIAVRLLDLNEADTTGAFVILRRKTAPLPH